MISSNRQEVWAASATDPEVDSKQHFSAPSLNSGMDATEWVNLYQQGEILMKQHRYEEARQCFLSCLAKETNSVAALYRMACLEANAGRLNEARKWAEEALDPGTAGDLFFPICFD